MNKNDEAIILDYLAVSGSDFSQSPEDVARKVADIHQLAEMDIRFLVDVGPRVQNPETGKTHYDMMATFHGAA